MYNNLEVVHFKRLPPVASLKHKPIFSQALFKDFGQRLGTIAITERVSVYD